MLIRQVEKSSLWFLFVALVILNTADFELTKQYFLILFGADGEANPIMNHLVVSYGPNSILFAKLLFLTVLALGILRLKEAMFARWLFIAMVTINVFTFVIVVYSLICINI